MAKKPKKTQAVKAAAPPVPPVEHPLIGAYKQIRKDTPFDTSSPHDAVRVPLEKVFFSYLNEKLKAEFHTTKNFLFYQIETLNGTKNDKDSYGIHFEVDFKLAIIEISTESVSVSADAPFFHTDNAGKINTDIFSNLKAFIDNRGKPDGLILVDDSGANHTKNNNLVTDNFTIDRILH